MQLTVSVMLWFRCSEIIPGVAIGIAFIAVCLGAIVFFLDIEDTTDLDRICRMAEASESNLESYKEKKMTAFIVGYTGEVGKVLVKHLAKTRPFEKVYLLGRRQVNLDVEDPSYFEQKIVDFENLDDSAEAFKDVNVGFCTLGTTKGKAGAEGFVRVDYDYVVKTAELAKNGGCSHFHLVSSKGADKNSSMLYTKTKGQVEEALNAMHFPRMSVYRPGVLMCDRQEFRSGEAVARFLLKPFAAMFPTAITTPVEVLVKAMTNNTLAPMEEGKPFELFENKAIFALAGELKKACQRNSQVSAGEK